MINIWRFIAIVYIEVIFNPVNAWSLSSHHCNLRCHPAQNNSCQHSRMYYMKVQSSISESVSQYFDEFDFCLESKDSAFSGPSMTKALNRKTNLVVKNILILNAPEDRVPAEKELHEIMNQFKADYSGKPGFDDAFSYLGSVCLLGTEEPCASVETLEALPHNYRMAHRRVLSVLGDFGCSPLDPKSRGRALPVDTDICLSVLDAVISGPTRTKALNALSNRVVRTMCVGNDEDLACLAREMASKKDAFFSKWGASLDDWKGSQEDMFYHALIELLSKGLTANPQKMKNPWSNAFSRVMSVLVQELGARRTPASSRVLTSFVSWESDLRRNFTSTAWDQNPLDLVGSWVIGDDMDLLPDVSEYVLGIRELRVTLHRDGSVEIPQDAGVGMRWRLDPGPTHLDTLRFEVRARGEGDGMILLNYTGYVDRGARIEARFSRRPLKMTGRLTRTVRGEPIPSTRFSMRLVERLCVKTCKEKRVKETRENGTRKVYKTKRSINS